MKRFVTFAVAAVVSLSLASTAFAGPMGGAMKDKAKDMTKDAMMGKAKGKAKDAMKGKMKEKTKGAMKGKMKDKAKGAMKKGIKKKMMKKKGTEGGASSSAPSEAETSY